MPLLSKTVESLTHFLELCAELVDKWSTDHGELTLWYRGQRCAEWHLTPSEYRYPLLDAEEIRSEFMLKARELVRSAPATDWEWYFLMQHYGLPTRLLDWTAGSLIGLHFALWGNTGQTDAAVWVLDPWALNHWSCGCSDLVVTGPNPDPIAKRYLGPVYKTRRLPKRPIAIVPPYNSQRITAQRGTFTVHGSSKRDLDAQFTSRLAKLTIPKDLVVQMRRQLRIVGISEFTLFPDLDGLCRDIRALEVEGC
jgi:hypothetical protein